MFSFRLQTCQQARETHVDTTLGVLRALDLDRVHRLLETGLGEHLRGVADAAAGRDELSSTTVDGVGVELEGGKKPKSSAKDMTFLIDDTLHTVTSMMLKRIPRMCSSVMAPCGQATRDDEGQREARSKGEHSKDRRRRTSLVAHWKAATHESLISDMNWTPLVTSTRRLGPAPSGP